MNRMIRKLEGNCTDKNSNYNISLEETYKQFKKAFLILGNAFSML